jgi:hypothetical protein
LFGRSGGYRSLANAQQLRDEQVRFNNFCLAKGTDDCPRDTSLPDFSLTPSVLTTTVAPGGTKLLATSIMTARPVAMMSPRCEPRLEPGLVKPDITRAPILMAMASSTFWI